MKDLKRHTPSGLNDLPPQAYARLRDVERRIEAVFESYGYAFISGPALEYQAVFEGKGSVPPARMYGFPDRNGDMLALRPDMTPSAARIAATNAALDCQNGPLRLCYMEKAFRNHAHLQGKTGEFIQAGVELMGVRSAEADAEVVSVAVKSLLATGLIDFRVDIGQVDFLRGVLLESGFDDERREMLNRFIIGRDYVAVEKCLSEDGSQTAEPGARMILSNLTRWMGGPDMLRQAAQYVTHPLSVEALRHLEAVYEYLCDLGVSRYVLFDLSMTGHLDYYTGVILRCYAHGSGFAVAEGGRYDRLLSAFGKPSPAVGFALRLDGVLDALEHQPGAFEYKHADTLLAYTNEGRAAALKTADTLREQGVMIENSLLGSDEAANLAYAKQRSLSGVLYFIDADTVKLHDLMAGTERVVSIADL